MNIPTICTRKKKFDRKTGLQIEDNRLNDPYRFPMESLCDSLDVPIKYIGKYVKESREARLLIYCILMGKKLRILWPKFVENLAIWKFLEDSIDNESNSLNSLSKQGDYYTFFSFLRILKDERELSLSKMSFQIRSILEKLIKMQNSLVLYSGSNLGIYEEIKSLKIPKFGTIENAIIGRAKLSYCEKSLFQRIEGILEDGIGKEVYSDILCSWNQFFENLKRKRELVEIPIPNSENFENSKIVPKMEEEEENEMMNSKTSERKRTTKNLENLKKRKIQKPSFKKPVKPEKSNEILPPPPTIEEDTEADDMLITPHQPQNREVFEEWNTPNKERDEDEDDNEKEEDADEKKKEKKNQFIFNTQLPFDQIETN